MSDYDEMLKVAETRENAVEAAFQTYDADKSGAIEDTEVMCLLQDLGKLPKTNPQVFLAGVFTKYDTDNNGVLTFEEFKGFYNAAVLDANGRGFSTSIPTAPGAKKKAQIAEMKRQQTLGKGEFASVAAAGDELLDKLSVLVNSKLQPKQQKEWFKIFKEIDNDNSGRIVFKEFRDYIRGGGGGKEGLALKKKDISDDELQAVWAALDPGGKQGCLKSKEFGAFMRRGQGDAGPGWKERQQAAQDAKGKEARA